MTTIVYDHKAKQIACDSRICKNDVIGSDSFIKYKHIGAELWFFCGTIADANLLVLWFDKGPKPELIPECEALAVINGKVYHHHVSSDGVAAQFELEFSEALGSGCKFAISAIDHGKSAAESVEYAMKRDPFTGGKIHVYDIASARFLE